MAKKKIPEIEITELFLVKADWNRTFLAQLIRGKKPDGSEIIHGSVIINEGKAWSVSESEEMLGQNLDDICVLKLDQNLHSNAGVTTQIFGEKYFLN